MEEAFIQVNGRQVRYAKIGEKGPLIFILHGWPSSLESWQEVGTGLALAGFQVVIPDFPGFGQSQEPPRPWHIQDYAFWLSAFVLKVKSQLSMLDDNKVIVVGHSFGGRVAIQFAAAHSEELSKLVLVAAAGIKKKTLPILKYISQLGKAIFSLPLLCVFKPLFRKVFYKFIVGTTDYINAKGVMQETFKNVVKEDLSPLLSQIKTPTLLIWGSKDKKTPLEEGKKMSFEIRNSKLEIIRRAGHSPNKEVPELLVQKVLDFLLHP